MVESNELWCPKCDVTLEDPEIHLKTYGQVDTCPMCNNKYEKYNV